LPAFATYAKIHIGNFFQLLKHKATKNTKKLKVIVEVFLMSKVFCFVSIFLLAFILNVTANVPSSTPDEGNLQQPQQSDNKCWVSGRIVWQEHNLKNATVQLFKDQKLKEIYTKGLLRDPEGTYALEIDDPGTYYMVAFVDDNGNDKIDAGDGMGIYGVMDWSDPSQQPEPLKLTKGLKLSGVDVVITAIANEQGRIVPISSSGSANVTTGISGKLILPSDPYYKFTNTLIFVYTDPTWNNRVTQVQASQTGEYAVSVPAGKYYVLAIIDENKSNLLDAGDRFGVWGMTRFGVSPKPIEVTEGSIKANRNIMIIGRMNKSGKPVPLYKVVSVPENNQIQKNVSISGKVVWTGHELKNAIIQAYDDPSMTSAIAKAKADKDGNFQMNIPEGEYYITAGIDSDGNGKYTKGDGIGVYGAEDATSQTPKKLIVNKDFKDEINILVTAEFDDSGQLKPITNDKQKDNKAEVKSNTDLPVTGIKGKIIWNDHKLSDITLVFSKDSSFKEGFKVPLKLDSDGTYACSTDPGVHYLMAIVDINGNEQTDTDDGIGFYGTGYLGEGHWGEAQSVTVLESRVTPYININITAIIGDDGKPSATPDGVRSYYGDPNDIFNTDKSTQEWWYWTRGIAFTFNKIEEVWKLVDVYQFTQRDVPSKNPSENKASGIIYYTLDENIWVVDGDGLNRRRVASGISVTGTFDGDKLLFFDRYNGLGLFSTYDQKLTKLGWLQIVPQPALSNDGKSVALTRESKGNRQIVIVNIETGNEMKIPGENLDMSCPSWSPDGELLAYSVSIPSIPDQQQNRNRDIYYYDLVAKRTERVTSNTQDDFDPAWSPTEARMMVFSRSQLRRVGQTEGDSSQLWLVNFDTNGKPSEKQLTKYGGRKPAWSPNGDKVIYENNAQLWTIKLDGTDETPILVNDEPIFGLDPFWTK